MASFGRRLRAARAARGWSLRTVATYAKVSHAYVSRLEKDIEVPSVDVVGRLAMALESEHLDDWCVLLGYVPPDISAKIMDLGPRYWKLLRQPDLERLLDMWADKIKSKKGKN